MSDYQDLWGSQNFQQNGDTGFGVILGGVGKEAAEPDVAGINHACRVVRIADIKPHPNADRLEIVHVGGFQCVVGKGQFQAGDLAVYVPPDSIVPERPEYSFVWERDGGGNLRNLPTGEPVPEKYRRVTVKRLRGEWSEGLLLAAQPYYYEGTITPNGNWWLPSYQTGTITIPIPIHEGEDVAAVLGIAHYNPPEPDTYDRDSEPGPEQHKRWPRSLKGWLYFLFRVIFRFDLNGRTGRATERAPESGCRRPYYDVANFKHFTESFREGEEVLVTEKVHGSNARFTYSLGKMYAGSRTQWKKAGAKCIWRDVLKQHPWIEKWCRQNPNYTLYGEVVPTQGDTYTYGCGKGETNFFVFDILDPEGNWLSYHQLVTEDSGDFTLHEKWVPIIYKGGFRKEEILKLAEGRSHVPAAKHIREGIVIRPHTERHVHGLGRLQLKVVSNEFLEAELGGKKKPLKKAA